MPRAVSPERTFALVVGVERYETGAEDDLHGPAMDARRFVGWLRSRGVPAEQILLFITARPQNAATLSGGGVEAQPATQALVRRALTETLRAKAGDLLYLFWGGHGVITPRGDRRLFYADATEANPVNLDLDGLLATMRSDFLPGFGLQAGFVDACANFVAPDDAGLPHERLPLGQGVPGREQFVLVAAAPGEGAQNLDERNAGRFSADVMDALDGAAGGGGDGGTPWPPAMDRIYAALAERYAAQRAAGEAWQTPAYLWHRDWTGSETTFGSPATARALASARPPAGGAAALRRASFPQRAALADALLACRTMADGTTRQSVVEQLRPAIAGSVPRNAASRIDVMNILSTCLDYAGGLEELLLVLRFFEADQSLPMRAVEAAARPLLS